MLKAKTKSYRRDLLFSLISKINTLRKPFFIFIALSAFKKASHLTHKSSSSTKCSENMYSFCANLQHDIFTLMLGDANKENSIPATSDAQLNAKKKLFQEK